MAINGQIVDEINGIIASRDSIRSTMYDATIVTEAEKDTAKLADLATKLAAAKLGATTYNVSSSNQTISAGKLTTGAQTIRAVTTSGIDAANIKSGTTIKVGDAADDDRIITVTGTFTKEDNNPITAATVLSGKVGYVNGNMVTGNIATVTPSATSLNCGDSATIAKGYLASDVTIKANSLASQTAGTAAVGDIRSGKTAWVGGTQLTGSMPDGTYSASVSVTNGSASISATGVSTESSSNCYITLSTSAGSAKGTATIGTGGYIAAGSKESSSTSVSVSGDGTKLYLATYTPSTITVTNSSQTLSTSGKVCTGDITIPAVNYYYTSLEGPSDSQGNNGDIWLVVNPNV